MRSLRIPIKNKLTVKRERVAAEVWVSYKVFEVFPYTPSIVVKFIEINHEVVLTGCKCNGN